VDSVNTDPVDSVSKQIHDGVDVTDLDLPKIPRNEVSQWDAGNPLEILFHESLSDYVFRWLNPRTRERSTMEGWRYVSGDLSIAVRRCGIIQSLIGGDGSDEMIRNGDLVLGWMPREWMDQRKAYYNKINTQIRESVVSQQVAEESMKNGSGSRWISKEGSVKVHVGNS
jgi:hypothetical protein